MVQWFEIKPIRSFLQLDESEVLNQGSTEVDFFGWVDQLFLKLVEIIQSVLKIHILIPSTGRI